MKIKTASGIVSGNKRSPYIKWLQGWINGGGWSGAPQLEPLGMWRYLTENLADALGWLMDI